MLREVLGARLKTSPQFLVDCGAAIEIQLELVWHEVESRPAAGRVPLVHLMVQPVHRPTHQPRGVPPDGDVEPELLRQLSSSIGLGELTDAVFGAEAAPVDFSGNWECIKVEGEPAKCSRHSR